MPVIIPGMKTQNQVKRILSQPEAISHIRSILDGNESLGRTALSDQLCEHYGFYDPLGGLQRGSCMKALRELNHRGHIVLPMSIKRGNTSPRRLLEQVPTPLNVSAQVGDVQGLKIILEDTSCFSGTCYRAVNWVRVSLLKAEAARIEIGRWP
jgi:hypothetical protein